MSWLAIAVVAWAVGAAEAILAKVQAVVRAVTGGGPDPGTLLSVSEA